MNKVYIGTNVSIYCNNNKEAIVYGKDSNIEGVGSVWIAQLSDFTNHCYLFTLYFYHKDKCGWFRTREEAEKFAENLVKEE